MRIPKTLTFFVKNRILIEYDFIEKDYDEDSNFYM